MGIFDFLFGSGSNPQTGSVATQAYSQAPEYFKKGLESLVTRGQSVSERPYPSYTGQRVAGFNPQEEQAFSYVGDTFNQYSPQFGQAMGMTAEAGAPTTDVSQYMNPFNQQVIDTTLAEMNRQGAMGLNALRGQAANSGNLNSTRMGVAEAEYLKNQDLNKAMVASKLGMEGYTNAQQMAQLDANRKLQAAGGLGQLALGGQQYDVQGAGALQAAGGTQRALGQTNMDIAYQDFTNQRDWDMNQLRNFGSILQGTPIGTVTNTGQISTTTQPGPSTLQNIAGLGTLGIGGYLLGKQLFAEGGLVDDKLVYGGNDAFEDKLGWDYALKMGKSDEPSMQDMVRMKEARDKKKYRRMPYRERIDWDKMERGVLEDLMEKMR